jgi:TM2 domain-containing membrane protein YozV
MLQSKTKLTHCAEVSMSEDNVSEKIDARPIRVTSGDTVWDRAVAMRDEFEALMRTVLERESVDALVLVSATGNYPPWVKLEAWLPSETAQSGRERVDLELVVDVKPYHKYPLVVTASLSSGRRKMRVVQRPTFSTQAVEDWTHCAIGLRRKPRTYHPFRDACLALLGRLIPGIGRSYRNPIRRGYRNLFLLSWTGWLGLLSLTAIIIGVLPVPEIPNQISTALAPVGLVGLVLDAMLVRRRKRSVSVSDQPVIPPRDLVLVDSWHAVIAEFGRDYANVRQRLVGNIMQEDNIGMSCRMETYGYRTPNGYEERERFVVSKGQGVVHVHIYPFGDDVFVGWLAHLNWAKWDETRAVSIKVHHGEEIEFRELRRGLYLPNQFDLIDLNSLSELVHRRLERETKALLKEKAIDQEVDFKIIRGDRERALDASKHGEGQRRGLLSRTGGPPAARD